MRPADGLDPFGINNHITDILLTNKTEDISMANVERQIHVSAFDMVTALMNEDIATGLNGCWPLTKQSDQTSGKLQGKAFKHHRLHDVRQRCASFILSFSPEHCRQD